MIKYRYLRIDKNPTENELEYFHLQRDISANLRDCKIAIMVLKTYPQNEQKDIADKYIENIAIKDAILKHLDDEKNIPTDVIEKIPQNFKIRELSLADAYAVSIFEQFSKFFSITIPLNKFYDRLIEFVSKYPLQYFKDLNGLYTEQINYGWGNPIYKDKCSRYFVEILENNISVISMFVWVLHFESNKDQQHFFIVKNIFYVFYKFLLNEAEIPNSSLLLHSFAASLFGSDRWYTSPLASMADILRKSNIKFTEYSADDPIINNYIISRNKYFGKCGNAVLTNIYVFVDIPSMKDLWLKDYEIVNKKVEDLQGYYILKKKQSGGYYYKYQKYKAKYMELKKNSNQKL